MAQFQDFIRQCLKGQLAHIALSSVLASSLAISTASAAVMSCSSAASGGTNRTGLICAAPNLTLRAPMPWLRHSCIPERSRNISSPTASSMSPALIGGRRFCLCICYSPTDQEPTPQADGSKFISSTFAPAESSHGGGVL